MKAETSTNLRLAYLSPMRAHSASSKLRAEENLCPSSKIRRNLTMQLFFLFSSSIEWMRHTHIRKAISFIQTAKSSVSLIQIHVPGHTA